MIAGIVLAGGTSSRLGRPKQLLPWKGRPILQHVIDAALAAGLDEVVVVLGYAAEEVRAGLELPPEARAAVNADYAAGQSTSLRLGLRHSPPSARAAVVLLGDQPETRAGAIRAVVEAYERTGGPVVRARYGHRPGHPLLFDRSVWSELEALEGDRGARDVLVRHPEWIVSAAADGEPPADVDTWEDYERLVGQPGAAEP